MSGRGVVTHLQSPSTIFFPPTLLSPTTGSFLFMKRGGRNSDTLRGRSRAPTRHTGHASRRESVGVGSWEVEAGGGNIVAE